MKTFLAFLFIALFSIPLGGYQFGVKDQITTIPIYQRILNPNLYPHDYYYPQPNEGRSIDVFLITKTAPLFPNLEVQLFIFYVLFHTLWLFSIFRLALLLLKNKHKALFALLFFITSKFVAGTGAVTYDLSLLYRTFAMPFAILSFVFFFEKKRLFSTLFMIVAGLFHPLSALYIGYPLWIAWTFPNKRPLFVRLGIIGVPFIFIVIANYLVTMPLIFDSEWKHIVQSRLPFVFLSSWKLRDWGNVVFFSVLFLVSALHLKPIVRQNKTLFLSLLIAFLAAFAVPLLGQITNIAPLVQIQFARILTLPIIITLILFSAYIWITIEQKRSMIFLLLLLLAVAAVYLPQPHVAFFVALFSPLTFHPKFVAWSKGHIKLSPIILFTTILLLHGGTLLMGYSRDPDLHFIFAADQNNPWIQTQRWAKENTPTDAQFLYDPSLSGWRVFSQRGSVVEYKDGTASIFARPHAFEWSKRMQDLQNINIKESGEISDLKKKYNASYVIRRKESSSLEFPIAYENSAFRVFALKE